MIYTYQHIQIPEAVNAEVLIPEMSEIIDFLVVPTVVGVDHLYALVRVNDENEGYDKWMFSIYPHGYQMTDQGSREEYKGSFVVNRQIVHLYGYKTFD